MVHTICLPDTSHGFDLKKPVANPMEVYHVGVEIRDFLRYGIPDPLGREYRCFTISIGKRGISSSAGRSMAIPRWTREIGEMTAGSSVVLV